MASSVTGPPGFNWVNHAPPQRNAAKGASSSSAKENPSANTSSRQMQVSCRFMGSPSQPCPTIRNGFRCARESRIQTQGLLFRFPSA
ncbi:hypothetical protein G6F55_014477 [Rhizopus delemar]|nr:hypothetical protein G6F55_014477 [Rhizopus delemar]